MKIVLLAEAQRRFEAEDARMDRLEPRARASYRLTRGKRIQRVLMQKTRCHIYYWHDRERDIVEVHTIWGAHRERGPKL